jgi:hypothetical protein
MRIGGDDTSDLVMRRVLEHPLEGATGELVRPLYESRILP